MPVAIVTGASRGIGRAIALRLADDGMDVAVNDIEPQRAELEQTKVDVEKKGRRSMSVYGDVSLEDDVERLVDSVVKEFGELNVFIANAGIIITKGMFEISVEEWDRQQAVNVRGVFLCLRKAGKQMIAQGKGGKIVSACSVAGYRGSPIGLAYSASKWAVRGITQGVAQELAPHNINVNAYCPGPVQTDMWNKIDDKYGVEKGLPKWAAFEASVQARTALKRASTPEDIAGAVSFLASKNANQITGQSILVDGGIVFS